MEIVQTLSVLEKAVFLMDLQIFQSVATDEVALIAAKTLEVRLEADEWVDTSDSIGQSFFVVVEGEVHQYKDDHVVRRAKRGVAFGLMGLMGLDEGTHPAQAVAPTLAIALPPERFEEAVADHPSFAMGFIRGLAHSIGKFAERIEALERKAD